ncbi:MAG TPA: SipW-dependent-type signal peptide-containing protein [Bacillota bacterium]|jgi:predicted ribosomally synthesized peptide with SipW-like signal peptide|nr:hypothetical protein [Fastidiosipila sp.]HPX93367.1 SipW-dependent-type signal peptide-containing protein [Bacillota bacterium]HQB80495.1 SipW-dependent-type signal peptide-containing protein [Bacillota bacterium]
MKKKSLVIAVALVAILAIGLVVTIAYFTDKKDVTNTFTVGNLKIDLTEPNFPEAPPKLLPGTEIPKDPTVKLLAGSEDAYVFMQLKPEGRIMDFLKPISINSNWIPVTGGSNLYVYATGDPRTPAVVTAGTVLPALFDKVEVIADLDNRIFEGYEVEGGDDVPAFDPLVDKLTINAFAHQAYVNGVLSYTIAEDAAKVQLP